MVTCAICNNHFNRHNYLERKLIICKECRDLADAKIEIVIALNQDEEGNEYV